MDSADAGDTITVLETRLKQLMAVTEVMVMIRQTLQLRLLMKVVVMVTSLLLVLFSDFARQISSEMVVGT